MLVDIIIPAYNPGPYLEDALNSALNQTYKDYTITVIDDNSSEDITTIVSRFPSVRYIRNDKNLGPAASRNIGIRSGKGELISLLDADDIWSPNKLMLSVKEFADADVGLVCGNYQILVNRKKLLLPFYRNPIKIDWNKMMKQNFVASGSTTFRRSAAEGVGLFNEKYWISEDYEMWTKLSEKHKIKYIHKILYYYSVIPKGDSLTNRPDIQERHTDNIEEIRLASRARMSL